MLIIARTLSELDFDRLMEIYVEGCLERGQELYPDAQQPHQIRLGQREFHRYLKEQFFTKPGAEYAVWEAEGAYVSALRLEPYLDGLLMEALETAPEHRRKGYAEALIRTVLARRGRTKLYSHVGKWNAPSLAIHEKCGFRRIREYTVYADGSVNNRCCTMCHE